MRFIHLFFVHTIDTESMYGEFFFNQLNNATKDQKVPQIEHMTVTINGPHMEMMKQKQQIMRQSYFINSNSIVLKPISPLLQYPFN